MTRPPLPTRPAARVMTPEAATGLVGEPTPHRRPNVTGPVLIVDAATGDPLLAYHPLARADREAARAAVTGIRWHQTARQHTGIRNRSRTFGMAPRGPHIRREGCRAAGLAVEDPERNAALAAIADVLHGHMREILPEVEAADRATLSGVLPEWRITADAPWTSGVVNQTSTLPYHRASSTHATPPSTTPTPTGTRCS